MTDLKEISLFQGDNYIYYLPEYFDVEEDEVTLSVEQLPSFATFENEVISMKPQDNDIGEYTA